MSRTEGTEWPHYEVRVKEELNERETKAEQLAYRTLHAAGVDPLMILYHARARTCADADEFSAGLRGAFTKTLFMRDCSEPPVFWLVLTVGSARPDLTALKKTLKAKSKLRMGDEKELLERLNVTPGAVTPLALVNDTPAEGRRPIRFVIDRIFWKNPAFEGLLNVHPMHNAASMTLPIDGLVKYIKDTGHDIHAYIDTTVTPMGIEIVDKSVLLETEQQQKPNPPAKQQKTPKSAGAADAKKGKKGAPSPEELAKRKRFAAAFALAGAGAALGSADGKLDATGNSATAALKAICDHAGVEVSPEGISGIELAFNPAENKWQMPAHVVLHLAAAEGLLSGKTGDDLAGMLKERFAGTDASKRYQDSRENSAEAACRSLSFGLALHHELDGMINTVLACTKEAGCAGNRIAACIAAFFARCAENQIELGTWKHEVLTTLLPAVKTALPDDVAAVDEAVSLWTRFGEMRKLGEKAPAVFQDDWSVSDARDKFYAELFGEQADKNRAVVCTIVAYDALLFAEAAGNPKTRWCELLAHCAFGSATTHTMTIAGFCFGVLHQFESVPDKHTRKVDQANNLSRVGAKLFDRFGV